MNIKVQLIPFRIQARYVIPNLFPSKHLYMRPILLALLLTVTSTAQTNVLFIGNSYTSANNLQGMVEDVANSAGIALDATAQTVGGGTLYQHSTSAATYAAMGNKNWDYVVFQAQSQEPAFPTGQFNLQTLPYANELVDSCRSIVPCAQPVFFRTWGRKYGDQSNCINFPPLCTYEGMDSLLHLRYRMMSDSNDAYLSPVGTVWRYLRNTDTTIELYTSDNSHPSLAGTYAAACTFFTLITRENPLNILFDSNLSAGQALAIRQAAKNMVYDSLSLWNVGDFDVNAGFTSQLLADSVTVSITDTSAFADSIFYDFNDGYTSADPNPTHTFYTSGTYTITQYAFRCDKVDTTSLQVTTGIPFGISEQRDPLHVHPRMLKSDWPTQLLKAELFNTLGQRIWIATPDNVPELIDLPTGTYTVHYFWDKYGSSWTKVMW